MALSRTDLQVFAVPINGDAPEKVKLKYQEVEKLILERQEAIHSTEGLMTFFEDLHATFDADARIVHQLSDEALNIYFSALEAAQGKFLSDDVKVKKPTKAQNKKLFENLPDLGS